MSELATALESRKSSDEAVVIALKEEFRKQHQALEKRYADQIKKLQDQYAALEKRHSDMLERLDFHAERLELLEGPQSPDVSFFSSPLIVNTMC